MEFNRDLYLFFILINSDISTRILSFIEIFEV
jgi:hypothetical protein